MGRPKADYDTQSKTYRAWSGMKSRCQNPNDHHYKNWGGRGIKVCERWQEFNYFLEDMGECPEENMSLDRINNDEDYKPGNCRWTTIDVQRKNSRQSRYLYFNGLEMMVTEWAEYIGITRNVLFARLRNGWSIERALTQNVGNYSS